MRNSFVHVQLLFVSSVSIFGALYNNLWDGRLGRPWGDLCVSSLSLALPLQCSVESVKQLVPPSTALAHTHAHSRRPHCAGSLLSLQAVFGHRARASPARPAPSSRAERTIRGPARRGAGEEGPGREGASGEGERQEGAGTPDQGHRKGKTTSAKLFIFPKAMQSAGGGGSGGAGVRGSLSFLGSKMRLPGFVRYYGAGM